jgi:hypothetical protein
MSFARDVGEQLVDIDDVAPGIIEAQASRARREDRSRATVASNRRAPA